MTTNETQSKEWTGDKWRVIARPGQVISMAKMLYTRGPQWNGWMDDDLASACKTLTAWRVLNADSPVRIQALETAIAYAWPESVGTFTERGVTG